MSRVPFEWTVNPIRGCVHRCTYCFARRTHEYLEFDAGHDFDTQIVVKVNVAEVLRRELSRPRWRRAPSRWAPTPTRTSGRRGGTG